MNNEPMVLDYRALITPKGIVALVVRNPRLIPVMAKLSTGKSWEELQIEGWKSEPCNVTLRDENTEVQNETTPA